MTETELKESARQKRLAYFKEWRSRNKDKIKQYNERHWGKKAKQEFERKN